MAHPPVNPTPIAPPPKVPLSWRSFYSSAVVVGVLALVNVPLLIFAGTNESQYGFLICGFILPGFNVVFGVLSLVLTPLAIHFACRRSLIPHLITSIVAPGFAIFVDYFVLTALIHW